MKKRIAIVMMLTAALLSACGTNKTNSANTEAKVETKENVVADNKGDEGNKAVDNTEKSTFTVGFDKDFPPMGFVGDDGEYTGFDLALAKEAAERMGKEIKYQPIDWAAKDMELESGTIDVIWNGFTMTGREDKYTWTEPYMENSQVFVVSKDSNIKSIADLKDKVVEVQADSSAEAALKEKPEIADTFKELLITPDYNTAFADLEMGSVDAVGMDVIVAGYQLQKRGNDKYVILDEKLSEELYGIGLKKGNTELRDKLQAVLYEMKKDGTMSEISNEWFGKDITLLNDK